MKKFLQKSCITFSLLLSFFMANSASAQLPFAASFDFGGEIKGVIQDIQAAFKTVETNIVGTVKSNLGKLQAAFDQYSGKITKVFDKIPGTKDFKIGSSLGSNLGSILGSGSGAGSGSGSNSSTGLSGGSLSVDIYNAESVQNAFTELFLTYPSIEKKVQIAYDNKSNKFYYDTLIEIKATITGLEEQLDKLRKEVEDFSEQAMSAPEGGAESGDSDGAASSEDESGIIYNAYLANRKFNDILKVTEEVVALQNQYFAAKQLRRPRSIVPTSPKETEQHSFLEFNQTIANAQFIKNVSNNKSYIQDENKKAVALPNDSKANDQSRLTTAIKQSPEDTKVDTKSDSITVAKQREGNIKDEKSAESANLITNDKLNNKTNTVPNIENFPTNTNTPSILSDKNSSNVQITTTSNNNKPYSQTEETVSYTDSDDFFAVPNAPDTSSPLKYSQGELDAINQVSDAQTLVDKATEVHNLLQQLPTYRESFIQFGLIKRLHDKAVAALEYSDSCVITYLHNYYDNVNEIWYGQNQIPEDLCDYDNRKGLSGWTIAAYQLANSSTGNNIDVEEMTKPVPGVEDGDPELVELDTDKLSEKSQDFVVSDIDTSEYSDSVRESDPEKMTEERDGETESQEDNFKDSDKAKEFSNTSREVSLINWQIGKQAAIILADDQEKSNPVYGHPRQKYPLWNDLRSYYNQYIESKYRNMKVYINQLNFSSATLQIVRMFNDAVVNEEVRTTNENVINAIAENLSNGDSEPNGLEALLQAKNAAIAALKQSQKNALAEKQEKVDKINKNIDGYSQLISTKNEEINKLSEEKTHNEGTIDSSQQSIDTLNKRGANALSSLFSQARQKLQEAGEKLLGNIDRLGILRAEVKTLENLRKKAKEKVAKLNEELEELKLEQQEALLAEEQNYDIEIANAQEEMPSPKLSNSLLSLNNNDVISMIGMAETLIDKAKECAATIIDDHLANLKAMAQGDALYRISNHNNVVSQHQTLINHLKSLPNSYFQPLVQNLGASILGVPFMSDSSLYNTIRNIFAAVITEDICSEYNCTAPDSDYFVGIIARKRDFTAPHAPLERNYPTVRDIVHLDTTDYRNIKMTSEGHLPRDSFLEAGIILPDIWERILSDKAFVERGVDLAAILNKGGEDKAFLRGMMLPCNLDHYIIDADENKEKYKVVDTNVNNSTANLVRRSHLSDCADLKIGAHALGLYTIKDTDVKKDLVGNVAATSIEDPVSSELGMFLKYENGHLSINNLPYNGFGEIIKKEKKAEKKGKLNLTAKDNLYERAMLTKNQIGEFLHFMDKEKEALEKLVQAVEDISEVRETLKTVLSALGYELNNNVNLANDEEYEEIVQKLKTSKNKFMGQAIAKLNGIEHSNPDVDERFEKVNNTYMALLQDNKALVNISANTEAGCSLAESIKSEEANKKVVEKSREDGYKALEDEINNYEQPICIPNGTIMPIPVESD